jgi:hypothetical protein
MNVKATEHTTVHYNSFAADRNKMSRACCGTGAPRAFKAFKAFLVHKSGTDSRKCHACSRVQTWGLRTARVGPQSRGQGTQHAESQIAAEPGHMEQEKLATK